jgi:CDP-paratose 2-epimerase
MGAVLSVFLILTSLRGVSCFRGGCLTGPNHSGAELHGFLAYMTRCFREGRTYRIFGHRGKQARDSIHSEDVCTPFSAFDQKPRSAAVYNLGGGRQNSTSILEAIARVTELFGRERETEYIEQNRVGDHHICYITDLRLLLADYPGWSIQVSLNGIFEQFAPYKDKDISVTS